MTLSSEQFNELVKKDEFFMLKDEFYELKDEFYELKDEVHELKDEVHELKDEVHEFKDEFKEFKEEVNEKFDIIIGMLEKSTKVEKDHEMEHVANIAAHDRF